MRLYVTVTNYKGDTAYGLQFLAGQAIVCQDGDAIARAISFAIEQPANADVGEIVIRPAAQGQMVVKKMIFFHFK